MACTTDDPGAVETFLTEVMGLPVHLRFRVAGEDLERTAGWPPSEGADAVIYGEPPGADFNGRCHSLAKTELAVSEEGLRDERSATQEDDQTRERRPDECRRQTQKSQLLTHQQGALPAEERHYKSDEQPGQQAAG